MIARPKITYEGAIPNTSEAYKSNYLVPNAGWRCVAQGQTPWEDWTGAISKISGAIHVKLGNRCFRWDRSGSIVGSLSPWPALSLTDPLSYRLSISSIVILSRFPDS